VGQKEGWDDEMKDSEPTWEPMMRATTAPVVHDTVKPLVASPPTLGMSTYRAVASTADSMIKVIYSMGKSM
jgi:hypothetical protein